MSTPIKNISIIGLGLIGGSIAKALKNSNIPFVIGAYDYEAILDKAFSDGVIDVKLESIAETFNSDIIFLCLPLEENLDIFNKVAPNISKQTILTDVSGIKIPFQRLWDNIESSGMYIGGHPMTGKEKGGFENSDPLLFENSVYIITEDLSIDESLSEFRKVIEVLGANILYIPAKQHDVIAASVSHLPQLIAVTLVNTASLKTDEYNFLDLAAGGFRDLTRIASSDYKIWDAVIRQNKNQIISAIEEFSYELSKLKKNVLDDNNNEIEEYFDKARKSRDEIPKNSKGFITPIHDIFVFVKDEPGVISKISTTLFKNDINIKDIELLKIREGTGGSFRISFESKIIAEKAKELISNLGFKLQEIK